MERQHVIKNFYKEEKHFLDVNVHFLIKMEEKR